MQGIAHQPPVSSLFNSITLLKELSIVTYTISSICYTVKELRNGKLLNIENAVEFWGYNTWFTANLIHMVSLEI